MTKESIDDSEKWVTIIRTRFCVLDCFQIANNRSH